MFFLQTVTDDELEMVGVLGPKCTKIYFDDKLLNKQVVHVHLYSAYIAFSHRE